MALGFTKGSSGLHHERLRPVATLSALLCLLNDDDDDGGDNGGDGGEPGLLLRLWKIRKSRWQGTGWMGSAEVSADTPVLADPGDASRRIRLD